MFGWWILLSWYEVLIWFSYNWLLYFNILLNIAIWQMRKRNVWSYVKVKEILSKTKNKREFLGILCYPNLIWEWILGTFPFLGNLDSFVKLQPSVATLDEGKFRVHQSSKEWTEWGFRLPNTFIFSPVQLLCFVDRLCPWPTTTTSSFCFNGE